MKTKLAIIGAGPIGLYIANHFTDFIIFEASSSLGGQLTRLYPKKEIVDIEGIDSITASEYIALLSKNINKNAIHLNEEVLSIENQNGIKIITNKGRYEAENVAITTGLGFTKPRPLELDGANECENIIYHIDDFSHLKNKRIAIFGGGDSALDWAKQLSEISDNVSLIHRRDEFRGNKDTIKNCKNLKVYLSYVPFSIEKESNKCKSITIKKVDKDEYIKIDVDYVLINFGNIAKTPDFNFPKDGPFFTTNDNFKIAENIYAAGDAINYVNKIRRINPGIKEADKIIKTIL